MQSVVVCGVGGTCGGGVPVCDASSRCASIRLMAGNTVRVSCRCVEVVPTKAIC